MIFPKVNEASLNKGPFFHIYENEDFELYSILSQKEVIENQIICHPIIYKSIFKYALFASNDLQRMEVIDCIFEDCDFPGCMLTKNMLHRVKFVNCKLAGTRLMESYTGNTLFENCGMGYINSSGSNIKESTFEHSILPSADFVDCSLIKIMFSTNDLENISFLDTNLKNIDLNSNSLEMIEVRPEHLKNCTLNQSQALGFVRKFLQIKVV